MFVFTTCCSLFFSTLTFYSAHTFIRLLEHVFCWFIHLYFFSLSCLARTNFFLHFWQFFVFGAMLHLPLLCATAAANWLQDRKISVVCLLYCLLTQSQLMCNSNRNRNECAGNRKYVMIIKCWMLYTIRLFVRCKWCMPVEILICDKPPYILTIKCREKYFTFPLPQSQWSLFCVVQCLILSAQSKFLFRKFSDLTINKNDSDWNRPGSHLHRVELKQNLWFQVTHRPWKLTNSNENSQFKLRMRNSLSSLSGLSTQCWVNVD